MSWSLERLRADVAEVLEVAPGELAAEDDLLDHGLDSVRVMALVERWRHREGAEVDFADLAAEPTLLAWSRLLGADG